ncbi:MAG TPA: N-acetyltransferase [Anaerolineales bacterium]|nr:N-acetyltransferase [Anaerolineales bacterium]
MEFKIRPEEAKDIEQVREILRAAFPTDAESRLVDALRANGKAVISLVAMHNDQVLGHILFSPVSITSPGGATPPGTTQGIGLAPVAVRPGVQSQGIGSELIRAGLRRCQELGYDYCVVLGSPKYYQRFGFEKASRFGVQNEYRVDDEFMLTRFSEHGIAPGLVKYAAEFATFSV